MNLSESHQYTSSEVERIIRRASRLKKAELISHDDLLDMAKELGLDSRTVETAIHELSHMYEGMDPFQIERLGKRMYHDMYTDGGQIHKHAVAGVEVACWDIMGKALGVPVYQMLGGQMRDRARAYANGW